jgi:hypothetical protein
MKITREDISKQTDVNKVLKSVKDVFSLKPMNGDACSGKNHLLHYLQLS